MFAPHVTDPTVRQLRQFGGAALLLLPLVGWWWFDRTGALVGLGSGTVLAILAWLAPPAVKPVYVGLAIVTRPIGIVVGELVLLFVFVAVFLPIGLLFRMIGRDPLQLQPAPQRDSYWEPLPETTDARSYFRQW